ncbi:MAG: hypothetical protein IPN51_03560 [Chloracidobacterium sp.]|nr:hypothetical protein [Chloracidobacterium sp.]
MTLQTQKYRDEVLPPKVTARLAVEAGVSQGWYKYVGDKGDILAVDRFGTSAPAEDVFRLWIHAPECYFEGKSVDMRSIATIRYVLASVVLTLVCINVSQATCGRMKRATEA